MLRKNKIPLLLLAVVVMLSIFYIQQTKNQSPTTPVNGGGITGEVKYSEYASLRLNLLEVRNEEINQLEAKIAAGNLTSAELETTVASINQIYNLKYSEVDLENQIISLGYDDVFVCTTGKNIKINILTDDFTTDDFVTVALLAKEKFARNYAVSVQLTSPEL